MHLKYIKDIEYTLPHRIVSVASLNRERGIMQ